MNLFHNKNMYIITKIYAEKNLNFIVNKNFF